jgi:hypothetical protein
LIKRENEKEKRQTPTPWFLPYRALSFFAKIRTSCDRNFLNVLAVVKEKK